MAIRFTVSSTHAQNFPWMNKLGHLLRNARETLALELGREITEGDVAAAINASGVPMERKTYSNIETGRTKTIKPKVAAALTEVLPVTGLQIVQALGYEVAFEGIRDEEEVALLEAFRLASDPARRAVRGALGLPPERPPSEHGRSLRRLAAMARQDRRGTQE